MQPEIVKEFEVTVGVIIRRWPVPDTDRDYFPDGYQYDWIADRLDSEEWYQSAKEAELNARRAIGDK